MNGASLSIRVFTALLVAVAPMLLLGFVIDSLSRSLFGGIPAGLVVIGAMIIALGWALILTIISTRVLAADLSGMITLARRGEAATRGEPDAPPDAYGRLAAALDQRNQQVATLAAETQAAPIARDPRAVASHVVRSARHVTGDPTWTLAVMRSRLPALLPGGVYEAREGAPVGDIGELERWATTVEPTGDTDGARARLLEGPWGAFLVVAVAQDEDLAAALVAPWEGRAEPSHAELDLLSLLGQHAGTALEHALLYSTVRSQADALDRMTRVQADFLRGVSHDLQTPLTSIRALASELQTHPGLNESAQGDLDVISHQADRLRRMVGQLLVMSRLDAGALTPRQEILAIRPLVERTWRALRADRPFTIEVSGMAQLVVADPDRLEQVMWALLDNAIKYSPAGSPLAVEISPSDAETMRMTITDHGTGMDPRAMEQAFDQFYRSENARRLVPDGSGVGLYAARGLVEAMGGHIEIASSLGHGTTVTLRFPAERADAEIDGSTSAPTPD